MAFFLIEFNSIHVLSLVFQVFYIVLRYWSLPWTLCVLCQSLLAFTCFNQRGAQCPCRTAFSYKTECFSTATFWSGFNHNNQHSYEGNIVSVALLVSSIASKFICLFFFLFKWFFLHCFFSPYHFFFVSFFLLAHI